MKFLSGFPLSVIGTVVAIAGAAVGIWLSGARRSMRAMIPFSGGLLLGVALFGLLPELAHRFGWTMILALFLAGYLIVQWIDRHVYPVCPSCSPEHDHEHCSSELHGFAVPLVIAASIHALLDGWSITGVDSLPLPLSLLLHKIPEGIALGSVLRAALGSRASAFFWSALTESATLAGGALAVALDGRVNTNWTSYLLAMVGGVFFYLGFHAAHGEWKRRGTPAVMPAVTGTVAAVLLLMFPGAVASPPPDPPPAPQSKKAEYQKQPGGGQLYSAILRQGQSETV